MYLWFSDYAGNDWTPKQGYNRKFAEQVQLFRQTFFLSKSGPGVEMGQGLWRHFVFQGGSQSLPLTEVYVHVAELHWMTFSQSGTGPKVYFRVKVQIAKPTSYGSMARVVVMQNKQAIQKQLKLSVFYEEWIDIQFPMNFPSSAPLFVMESSRFDMGVSAAHHMHSGGTLCIFTNSSDWNMQRDTIISAFNVSLEWMVWHHSVHGF